MSDAPGFFDNFRRFHLIGAGGIGMSGLAELLIRMGYTVTGSDLVCSSVTDRLERLGVRIHRGHDAAWVGDADVVIYSSAVPPDNPERLAAEQRGILSAPRADLLAAFLHGREGVAIAGTHGKTTTTAMTGLCLLDAGLDPTIIVGGMVPELNSNVRLGRSVYVVTEADEYDRAFLRLTPRLVVITTVDADHLEYYGSLEEIDRAFVAFAHTVPFYRPVVLNIDDPGVRRIRPAIKRRCVTYGFSEEAHVRADAVTLDGWQTGCRVHIHGATAGEFRLHRPGRHNLSNALAAVAVGDILGVPFERTQHALERYSGVKRRFEIKGTVNRITVVDDYAHHPAEVAATLTGVRQGHDGRVIAVFQPHLYSRTRDFADAFGQALAKADIAIVTGVYGSREKPVPGVTGEHIVIAARKHGIGSVDYVPDKEEVPEKLAGRLQPGDVVLTLGAGDIASVGEALLEALK